MDPTRTAAASPSADRPIERSPLGPSFAKREAKLIVAFLIVAVALLAVVRLGFEIREDGTSAFDRWMLVSLRSPGNPGMPIGPAWLRPVFIDISALGGVTSLTLLTVTAIGYLLAARRWTTAALLAAATGSGSLLGQLLKSTFARARPTLVPHLVEVHSLSFPSGHATNSAMVFLTLGLLVAREQVARPLRVYVVAIAIAATMLVGFSRVYNGVHWPTDVVAGWAIGASWALLWWAIMQRVQGREAGMSGAMR